MERAAADARYSRLHDERKWHDGSFTRWAAEPSREFPYRFDMGVTIGVAETDLRPDDAFLTRESAPLVAANKPDGEQDSAEGGQDQNGQP
jgi:hypothetical protein